MYFNTGLEWDEIIDLCIRIASLEISDDEKSWPPSLGLTNSLIVALNYKRHNGTQAAIGEWFGVSQSTISRAIKVMTPLIAEATREFVPTVEEIDPDEQ